MSTGRIMKVFFAIMPLCAVLLGVPQVWGQSGNLREAQEQFKKGERAFDAGNFEEAKRRFKRAVELDDSLAAGWEKLISIFYTEGNFEQVISLGETGLKANPGAAEIQLWMGLAHQMKGRVNEGTELLEKAVAKNPKLFLAYYEPLRKIGLGVAYLRKGENAKALDAFRAFMRYRSASLSREVDHLVLFRIGELELKMSRPAQALSACEEALKNNSRHASSLWCKAEALRALGRYTEAVPYFKRVASFGPQKPRVLMGFAISLLHAGNRDAAMSTIRRYLSFRPADPEGHRVMGDMLYTEGKRDEAIRAYQRAIKLNPEEMQYYIKSAIVQIQLNQFASAITTLNAALEKWQQETAILVPLAFALIQERRAAEAYDMLAKNPVQDQAAYMSVYGLAALRVGKSEEAYTILKKALQLRPKHENDEENLVIAMMDLSHRAVQSGDIGRATALLEEALSIRPQDARLIRNLAVLLLMQKKSTDALALLDRGLTLAPADFYLIRLKGRALMALEKYSDAIQVLTDARNRSRRFATDVQARVEMDLGVAMALVDNVEQAVTMFQEALSNALSEPELARLIEVNVVRSLIARASARLADGKGTEALADLEAVDSYKRVKLSAEEQRQMQFLMAMANLEQGKFKEAETIISTLSKAGPLSNLFKAPYDEFGPELLRAYIAYRQNRMDVARREFRAVMDKAPAEIKTQVIAFLRSCDAIEGHMQLSLGRSQAALTLFNAIPKTAFDAATMLNYGLALYQSGQQTEAINVWTQLNTPMAACNLGSHYHNVGDAPNSVKWLKVCVGAGLGGNDARSRLEFKQKLFNLQ